MNNFEQLLNDLQSPLIVAELLGLLVCVFLAWLMTWAMGRGAQRQSILFGRRSLDGLLFPLLSLVLVYALKLHWLKLQHAPLLTLAMPVLSSLAVVRLIARVLSVVFPSSKGARAIERGVFWLVWCVAVLWITGLAETVGAELDAIVFAVGKARFSLLHVLEVASASSLVLILTLWLSATLEQKLLNRAINDLSMRKVATNTLRAVLLLMGALVVLSLVGVDLTALSVLGGAVGVGLGFGLQKLAANYVSGFVILLERSLRIGDYVKVDGFEGRITDIKTRYTLIQAGNGSESVVPNELLMTARVENLSLQSSHLLLQCFFTVGLNSDVAQVQSLLLQAALQADLVLQTPEPSALLIEITPQGMRFQLNFWIEDATKGQMLARSQVNIAALHALRQANVMLSSAAQEVVVHQASVNSLS